MTLRLDSTTALLDDVAQGRASLEEVAAAVRDAAARSAALNAVVDGWEDGLTARAQACRPGPLHGLPIVAKDIFDVGGMATSGGTAAMSGRVARRDAAVVERLLAAGAFIAAKNTLHELSFGITTNNAFSGPARNPYDLTRIPGGSSGGTAAAVAAGVAPVGLAADTGGSSRVPAAFCGLVGFRPTHGRYPSEGIVPISHTRDTAGVIAHTVAEVALVDAVLAAMSEPVAPEPLQLTGVRLGKPVEYWTRLHPDVASACEAALARLADAGAQIVDVSVEALTQIEEQIAVPLCLAELGPDLSAYLTGLDDGLTAQEVGARVASPDVAPIVAAALAWDAGPAEHARLLALRAQLRGDYAALLQAHDLAALVFPTVPIPAPPIGEDLLTDLLGEQVPTFPTVIRHANLAGVAGHPGISVPCGTTSDGLPVGLEFDGAVDDDRALLALAAAVEPLMPAVPAPPAAPTTP